MEDRKKLLANILRRLRRKQFKILKSHFQKWNTQTAELKLREDMCLKLKVMGALFSQYNTQAHFNKWKHFAKTQTQAIEDAKKQETAVIKIKIDRSSKNK